ncbi:MAG TPA: hypothetical protein VK589_30020 [Chryseolinea sp.]|nr:hypothetical protein [Chryseolinea sp.]
MFEGQFNSDNWHRSARSVAERNAIRTRRWGMRVTVYLTGSSGDYVLSYNLASTNLQDNNNWLKVADIGETWGGGGGGSSTPDSEYFTGDGVEDTFTLADGGALIYFVEVGGQMMIPGTNYVATANVVIFTDPPANGIEIGVYYFDNVSVFTDPLEEVTVDTTGATITLDMAAEKQRMFVGSASFATAKDILTDDDADALVWNFQFEITNVAAVLSFPANYTMQSSDDRWDDSTKEFTPDDTGAYESSAVYDADNDVWKLKISDPFS